MTFWSDSPFPRVQERSGLVLGEVLTETGGQARRVTRIANHPGWIYKEYRVPPGGADVAQLDRLIAVPAQLDRADAVLVDRNTSWPVTRVTGERATVGVCLPEAPSCFQAQLATPRGGRRVELLRIDHLATGDDRLRKLGLEAQRLENRLMVCSSLTAVAALFERTELAYLDWSYANAFWSLTELSAYVIDVDGCSFGSRLQLETPGWEDPLVPREMLAGNEVDRYRVPLLVARCLTAERNTADTVLAALDRLARSAPHVAPLAAHVRRALTAQSPSDRPSLTDLAETLTDVITRGGTVPPGLTVANPGPRQPAVPNSGVSGWRDVRDPGRRSARPDQRPGRTPPTRPQWQPPHPSPPVPPMRPVPGPDPGPPSIRWALIVIGMLVVMLLAVLILILTQ